MYIKKNVLRNEKQKIYLHLHQIHKIFLMLAII